MTYPIGPLEFYEREVIHQCPSCKVWHNRQTGAGAASYNRPGVPDVMSYGVCSQCYCIMFFDPDSPELPRVASVEEIQLLRFTAPEFYDMLMLFYKKARELKGKIKRRVATEQRRRKGRARWN